MNNIPRSSGIYKIICVANGKIYVGSAIDLHKRWWTHRWELKKNIHPNSYLQNAYNKYGESAFEFEIIELVMSLTLIDREDYWLNELKACDRSIGFNIALTAESPTRGRKLKPRSSEYRELLRQASTGKRLSPETRAKIGAANKGRKPSIVATENSNKATRKTYIVTDPDGVEFQITGLRQFCKEHGLANDAMCHVARGKQKHHRGWKCRRV